MQVVATKAAQSPKRRVPTQERSRRRYDAIVESAGQLFADQGFDKTTMDAIAAGAETSIGSVYQFFDNKVDVFRAVAERCLERSGQLFGQLTAIDPSGVHWSLILDAALDGFYALQENDPAYRAVWANLQLYGEYAEADEALVREMIDTTASLISAWGPELAPARRKLIATMTVNTITSTMLFAAREKPRAAKQMVAETKVMLRAYLGQYLAAD